MMNTNPGSDNLEPAQSVPPREPAPVDETVIVEAVRNTVQVSLAGEAQNFRSWVAASHRKYTELQRLALATTALCGICGVGILLASVWEAHRVIRQADAQLSYLESQAPSQAPAVAVNADGFAQLRQANWEPVGKLITQKGRTFIELRARK
jgi:hypothetical protein